MQERQWEGEIETDSDGGGRGREGGNEGREGSRESGRQGEREEGREKERKVGREREEEREGGRKNRGRERNLDRVVKIH